MKSRAPVPNHRFARLHACARLWLEWLALFLCFSRDHSGELRETFAVVRRGIGAILFLRAAAYVAPSPRRARNHPGASPSTKGADLRAVLGSRFRARLRGRRFIDRVTALWRVLRDGDDIVAYFVRRLTRGLTRRRRRGFFPGAISAARAAFDQPLPTNSS